MKESLTQCYRHLEQDKEHAYEARVREVELGCFTPLVFSTSGGLGPAAKTVYKRLASLIAEKKTNMNTVNLDKGVSGAKDKEQHNEYCISYI